MIASRRPSEGKSSTTSTEPVSITPQTARVKRNWQIYSLYARGEHDDCLKIIEEQLTACKGQAEYPLYVKGLVLRERGQVQDSLQLFQAATVINPTNMANLKQVARSLYLLGKHSVAISVYDETEKDINKHLGLPLHSLVRGPARNVIVPISLRQGTLMLHRFVAYTVPRTAAVRRMRPAMPPGRPAPASW